MRSKRRVILFSTLAFLLLAAIVLAILFLTGVFSVDMGEVVMTYKGQHIYTAELTYWMATLKTKYMADEGVGSGRDTEAFWNSQVTQAQTHAQRFDEILYEKLQQILISKHLFEEYELSFPSGTDVDAQIKEKKSYYELYDELDVWEQDLERLGVNERQLRQIYLSEKKVEAVRAYLIDTLTAQSTVYAQELQAYFTENYLCVRYGVVYLNYDTANQKQLTSLYDIQVKREKADAFYAAATAAVQPVEDIISLYSEYDSQTGHQNGWFLTKEDAAIFGDVLYSAFENTQIGEWNRLEIEENGDLYAYVFCRYAISSYEYLSDTDQSTLANRTQNHYYQSTIRMLYGGIEKTDEIYSQYSVINTLPSKNTNL